MSASVSVHREPELLTVSEFAIEAHVNASTVRRWTREGRLAFVRTPGGHMRIPQWELPRLQRAVSRLGHNASDRRP